ncbi:hypothetical protein R3P38DRAFT_2772053 [Favolaschia claudopus]|uniref:Uncharacterized protein n=1 Tax=Favolaschia claudopus TaxID=2862362 RepID=A0AAV9YZC4_9AGAR
MPSGTPKAQFEEDVPPSTPYSTKSAFQVTMSRDLEGIGTAAIADNSPVPATPITPVPVQRRFAAHAPGVPVPSGWPSLVYTTPAPVLSVTGTTTQPMYYPSYPIQPFRPPPPRKMTDAAMQTVDVIDNLPSRTKMAIDFTSDIFNGIIPHTDVGGRQRTKFHWPSGIEIAPEDRLLVVFRAVKKAGFPTLGAFFVHRSTE